MSKGRACALHMTPEYDEGIKCGQMAMASSENPYDFFDAYEKHYAWDIGWQKGWKASKPLEKNGVVFEFNNSLPSSPKHPLADIDNGQLATWRAKF